MRIKYLIDYPRSRLFPQRCAVQDQANSTNRSCGSMQTVSMQLTGYRCLERNTKNLRLMCETEDRSPRRPGEHHAQIVIVSSILSPLSSMSRSCASRTSVSLSMQFSHQAEVCRSMLRSYMRMRKRERKSGSFSASSGYSRNALTLGRSSVHDPLSRDQIMATIRSRRCRLNPSQRWASVFNVAVHGGLLSSCGSCGSVHLYNIQVGLGCIVPARLCLRRLASAVLEILVSHHTNNEHQLFSAFRANRPRQSRIELLLWDTQKRWKIKRPHEFRASRNSRA